MVTGLTHVNLLFHELFHFVHYSISAWHCTNPVFRAILRGALLLYGEDVDLIEKYLEVSAISMSLFASVI